MAAKFFTGLPLDGPDPECVRGNGDPALAAVGRAPLPRPSGDHSHRRRPVPVSIGPRPAPEGAALTGPGAALTGTGAAPTDRRAPAHACNEHPLAGLELSPSSPPGTGLPGG
jgi:hypothetical protein